MSNTYLNNDRIYLRAVEPEDLDFMYNMENDPLLWDISSFTVPYSRYTLRQYIENNQNDIFADKQLRLMIIKKSDSIVLGTVDLSDFMPLHARAAIGIALLKNYRKEGYASDALKLVCDYAFNYLNLHQIYAYISIENQNSIGLFATNGFMRTGLLEDWLSYNNRFIDAIIMQKLNPNHL